MQNLIHWKAKTKPSQNHIFQVIFKKWNKYMDH